MKCADYSSLAGRQGMQQIVKKRPCCTYIEIAWNQDTLYINISYLLLVFLWKSIIVFSESKWPLSLRMCESIVCIYYIIVFLTFLWNLLSACWLVGRLVVGTSSVGRSVCHLKAQEVTLPCSCRITCFTPPTTTNGKSYKEFDRVFQINWPTGQPATQPTIRRTRRIILEVTPPTILDLW